MRGLCGTAAGLLLLWFSGVGKQHIAQNRYDIASRYFKIMLRSCCAAVLR